MSKKRKNTPTNEHVSTPAVQELEKAGAVFAVYTYTHSADHMDQGYGWEVASQISGHEAGQIFKTLLVKADGEFITAVVPVTGHLSLKALAAAVGAKKAAMAEPAEAMRVTGYVVGVISPLGQKTAHRTVINASAFDYEEMLVSGGKRGISLGIKPEDLLAVLNKRKPATKADIAAW